MPPSASHEHRQPDDDDEHEGNARTHQARRACEQTEPVATIDRAVVVAQDQVHEPEHQCADEGELECPHDVLFSGPEEHEHACDDGCRPRAYAGAAHDHAEQHRSCEVGDHDDALVGDVAAQTEHVEEGAIDQDRQRHPVLAVRSEQITDVAAVALRKKAPLVTEEPVVAAETEEDERECDRDVEGEAPECSASPELTSASLRCGTCLGRRGRFRWFRRRCPVACAPRELGQYTSGIQRFGSGYVDGAKNQDSKP